MTLLELLLIIVGGAIGIVGLRYVIAYLNAPESGDMSRFQRATNRTARWLGMIVGGVVVAVATGLVQFGEIVTLLTDLIGGSPFLFSNLAGITLGAGALSGLLDLSADQYVGLALAIAGAVFLLSEVVDTDAS